jgi:aerolysin toxin
MTISIEMTVRGLLIAGHWRTEAELNSMTTDNKRNTLIVVLTTITNQSVSYFQSLDDNTLIGKAAIAVFLLEAGLVHEAWLKAHKDDDARNALIVQLNMKTDRPIKELQGKSDRELVVLGLEWLDGAKMVTGIIDFSWKVDTAKILATVPDIIAEQTYLNQSGIDSHDKFGFDKDVTSKSTFSHEHGLTVKIGMKTEFEAGIPYMATNKTTVGIDVTQANTWKFGEENATCQKYSYESEVELPPHSKIKRTATVTRGSLDVPYRATVLLGDGSKRVLEGTWNGVSTYGLIVTQESLDTVNLKEQRETVETVEVNPTQFPAE